MSETVLPLGYNGAIRLRVAPKITLTPAPAGAVVSALKCSVSIKGASQNLRVAIPCSLEWHVQTDLVPSGVVVHPSPVEAVPDGDGFKLQEAGGKAIEIDVYALGVIGRGAVGYSLRLQMLGAEDVVVAPEKSGIRVDLPIGLRFERRTLTGNNDASTWVVNLFPAQPPLTVNVGNVFALTPSLPPAFKGHSAKLVFREERDGEPLAGTEQPHPWTVGDTPPTGLHWWAGMRSSDLSGPRCVTYGRHPCAGDSHRCVWELELQEPTGPAAKDKHARPGRTIHVPPQFVATLEQPVLRSFAIRESGSTLVAEGTFSGFDPKLGFDLELHLYAQFTPPAPQPSTSQTSSFLRQSVPGPQPGPIAGLGPVPGLESFPGLGSDPGPIPGLGSTSALGPTTGFVPRPAPTAPARKVIRPLKDEVPIPIVQAVPVHDNRFEISVASFRDLRAAGKSFPDLHMFAELCFPKDWCDGGKEPVPFSQLAHYTAAAVSKDGHVSGLEPFDQGRFSSYASATGVSSAALDLRGRAAELEQPLLETHWTSSPNENAWNHFIQKYADQYDVDALTYKALLRAESEFDPKAANNSGFAGLSQVASFWVDDLRNKEHVPGSAVTPHRDPTTKKLVYSESDCRFDPEYSIRVGAFALSNTAALIRNHVLAKQHYQVPEEDLNKLIVAAYNLGYGPIKHACDEIGQSKPITWVAITNGREASPLWHGIELYKDKVCVGFTVEEKYRENTRYVGRVFAVLHP